MTFVFIPEVSKAVNAHSPRGGHGVLRTFQYPVILGSHNNGALVLTSITDMIFFDLPGVYCRSLISSWRNKRKEIVLGRKEGKREARNPNLSRKHRTKIQKNKLRANLFYSNPFVPRYCICSAASFSPFQYHESLPLVPHFSEHSFPWMSVINGL